MKTKKILMLLAVAGLLGACASDEETRVTGEPVPIRLSASVEGSQTRTATTSTTGDTELLDGQDVDAYIKVKGGDWVTTGLSATVPRHFSVGTSGKLERKSGEAMDYYPMDGTPVSIYAVHPSIASAATFTVQSDQTDDANYAASDLSYCKTADYNRSESLQTLTFGHVLSKIIVNVQTDLGTVSSVKLWAKKSTTLTYPADNGDGYTLGTASGVGMIGMNDGGAAIIPPQTTTAEGDVRIFVEIENKGTFVYNIPASTSFESNIEYTYTVKIGASITVTSTITDWGSCSNSSNPVEIGRPILPIEYCCEYNMGAPSAQPMTMASDHLKASTYFYNEANSLSYFNKHITISGKSGTYHLPSIYELRTIASYYDLDFFPASETIVQTGKGEDLHWGKYKKNDTYAVSQTFYNEFASSPAYNSSGQCVCYAIRLKASDIAGPQGYGPYTCAYRYTVLDSDPDPLCYNNRTLRIKVRYLGAYSTVVLSDITNPSFWNESGVEYIERVFPDFGYVSAQGEWYTNCIAPYRSATLEATHSTYNDYYSMFIYNFDNAKNPLRTTGHSNSQYGTAIRLFKDAE